MLVVRVVTICGFPTTTTESADTDGPRSASLENCSSAWTVGSQVTLRQPTQHPHHLLRASTHYAFACVVKMGGRRPVFPWSCSSGVCKVERFRPLDFGCGPGTTQYRMQACARTIIVEDTNSQRNTCTSGNSKTSREDGHTAPPTLTHPPHPQRVVYGKGERTHAPHRGDLLVPRAPQECGTFPCILPCHQT